MNYLTHLTFKIVELLIPEIIVFHTVMQALEGTCTHSRLCHPTQSITQTGKDSLRDSQSHTPVCKMRKEFPNTISQPLLLI